MNLIWKGTGVVVACLLSGLTQAQEAAYLVPLTFVPTGGKAAIGLRIGESATAKADRWFDFPVRWLFVKTGDAQENRDSAGDWIGSDGKLQAVIPGPGAVMVGADFLPKLETVDAARLLSLLEQPAALMAGPVKVKHFRSAVALLRTQWAGGEDGLGTQIALSETGLTCDVRTHMDPTTLLLGGDLAFDASVRGAEVEGVKLVARHLATGATAVMEQDHGGLHFTPRAPGTYSVLFQTARALPDDPEAQFAVYSATLTFSVPAAKGGQR